VNITSQRRAFWRDFLSLSLPREWHLGSLASGKMAQQSEQLLRHLLEKVRVLTEQISQPNQSNVSAEVSRVFGRSQGRQGNPGSSINQNASPATFSHF